MKRKHPEGMPPRDRILRTAARLFHDEGIRGVGVETIAAEAETTKMAIYRHFASKDALVAEWLKGVIAEYSGIFDALEARFPDDARAQLNGWVEFIAQSLRGMSHRGCPFVNSLAELPDRNHPARQLIEAHKHRQALRIERLCHQAGIAQPHLASAQLTFLLEGAQVTAQNGSIPEADRMVRSIASTILGAASAAAPGSAKPLRARRSARAPAGQT